MIVGEKRRGSRLGDGAVDRENERGRVSCRDLIWPRTHNAILDSNTQNVPAAIDYRDDCIVTRRSRRSTIEQRLDFGTA
jgi:hypothetical protein